MRVNNVIFSVMPIAEAKQIANKSEYKTSIPKVDNAYISPIGRDLALVKKVLSEIPNIREDKVKQIKEQINNGTYNVTSEDLVNKLLNK